MNFKARDNLGPMLRQVEPRTEPEGVGSLGQENPETAATLGRRQGQVPPVCKAKRPVRLGRREQEDDTLQIEGRTEQ